jgi:hypothetical protein
MVYNLGSDVAFFDFLPTLVQGLCALFLVLTNVGYFLFKISNEKVAKG